MKKRLKFEEKVILSTIVIILIPLILSYFIFLNDKLKYTEESIKSNLKTIGFTISESELIQSKLYKRENDNTIQEYTKKFISKFRDIDIIAVCDMTGEKYSHLDTNQIGEIYVGSDKKEVLKNGSSYFSLKKGSMGVTFRWFQPIMYRNKQVGFVMVGKYYNDMKEITNQIREKYSILFTAVLLIGIIAAKIFGSAMKKEILNMEPYEIATLYNQKEVILNNVKDGIISLDENNNIQQVNKSCYTLFDNFDEEKVIKRLQKYIDNKEAFEMKEFIIHNKKSKSYYS